MRDNNTMVSIPGYSNYCATVSGGIVNAARGVAVKQCPNTHGYQHVHILKDCGKWHTVRTHCLIALAFLGERPEGLEIDHIDGNKGNNSPSNLRYVTGAENMDNRNKLGRINQFSMREVG